MLNPTYKALALTLSLFAAHQGMACEPGNRSNPSMQEIDENIHCILERVSGNPDIAPLIHTMTVLREQVTFKAGLVNSAQLQEILRDIEIVMRDIEAAMRSGKTPAAGPMITLLNRVSNEPNIAPKTRSYMAQLKSSPATMITLLNKLQKNACKTPGSSLDDARICLLN